MSEINIEHRLKRAHAAFSFKSYVMIPLSAYFEWKSPHFAPENSVMLIFIYFVRHKKTPKGHGKPHHLHK